MVKTQNVDSYRLEKAIQKSGVRPGFLCDQLGITRQALLLKRKGKNKFRKSEALLLQKLLNISDDEFTKIFCFESSPINEHGNNGGLKDATREA